jgi:hypothetical protein
LVPSSGGLSRTDSHGASPRKLKLDYLLKGLDNGQMDTFQSVVNSLQGERTYQKARWPNRKHSFDEYTLYMGHYLDGLRTHLSTKDMSSPVFQQEASHLMRKLTALGVACLEENGTAFRAAEDIDRAEAANESKT